MLSKLPGADVDLGKDFQDVSQQLGNLVEMLEQQKTQQILDLADVHLGSVCKNLIALVEGSIDITQKDLASQCHQLNSHAAALPLENTSREPMIQMSFLVKSIDQTGQVLLKLELKLTDVGTFFVMYILHFLIR